VMHAHNVKAHLHGALAARLAGVPVSVSTKHGRNFPTGSLSRAANRLACNLCSDLVGVSSDCAAIWRDIESADGSKRLPGSPLSQRDERGPHGGHAAAPRRAR
jgi:hypothetical protein